MSRIGQTAPYLDGIPLVASTAQRNALFPSPDTNQRVQNLETQYVERWTGTTWTLDIALLGAGRIFDVAGYAGAFVDGVTSDQGAIDLAYAAAVAAGGGVLYFRPGTWRGSVSVFASNIAVRGAGPFYTTLKQLDATYRSVSDAAMTSGQAILTSATAAFTTADVGKTVFVANAAAATGEDLIAKILSVQSATSATLDTTAGQTVSGKSCRIGCGRNVLEFGRTYLGNQTPQTQGGGVFDMTLDGNKASVSAPANAGDDLVLCGCEWTNHLYGTMRNLRIQNCHNAGFNPVINSNYIDVDGVFVTNCGSLTTGLPAFDINSCSYGRYRGVFLQGCAYGFRALDNCQGNDIEVTVRQTNRHGVILDCQSTNRANGNRVVAVVHEAATDGVGLGAYIGQNWKGNTITFTVAYTGGSFASNALTPIASIPAVQVGSETFADANKPQANTINLTLFQNCGVGLALRGNYNDIRVDAMENSQLTALSQYAVDIGGSWNSVAVHCRDSASKQRGIAVRAVGGEVGTAATGNIIDILQRNPTSPLDDSGTQTSVKPPLGGIRNRAETTGNVNITAGADVQVQRWTAALTANMSVTFIGNPVKGDRFDIVRADGSSAFTFTVNTVVAKVIPNSTAARVVCEYDGTNWVEVGYGVL